MKQMRPFMSNQGLEPDDSGLYDPESSAQSDFDHTKQEIVSVNKGEEIPENLKEGGIILEVQPDEENTTN